MRQLPIIALIVGIMLFFILVACDEDVPGNMQWNNQNAPVAPATK